MAMPARTVLWALCFAAAAPAGIFGRDSCKQLGSDTVAFLSVRPPASGPAWSSQESCTTDKQEEASVRWDLTLIESSFSACSVPAWINDTARYRVGENSEFSVSREACAGEGQYLPPQHRPRVMVFVDYRLPDVEHYGLRAVTAAWLVEPESLCPSCYEYVRRNLQSFDLILTHDDDLIAAANAHTPGKGIFGNGAVPSLDPSLFLGVSAQEFGAELNGKTDLVSIIVSSKTSTSGHRLRHEALRVLQGTQLHAYGSSVEGLRKLQDKQDAIRPYMFHIVIENTPRECYFTEKLLDSIVMRAVPIYWGCARIGDIFDTGGILAFETSWELAAVVAALSRDLYQELMPAVERNFELAAHAYSLMSPMHQLWNLGAKQFVDSLPRIVILSPTHESQLPLTHDVILRFAVKLRPQMLQEDEQQTCTVMVMINGLYLRSIPLCEATVVLPSGTHHLKPETNNLELLLRVGGLRSGHDTEDEAVASVAFELRHEIDIKPT